MFRSFEGKRYAYETLYIRAEQAAFRQATLISVVSQVIKDSLIDRGVDADKILVNPNGADLDAYSPASTAEKLELQRELGLDGGDCVVGFTGTFGGWHGIDVLAAAIPEICRRRPGARFLLIGDGGFRAPDYRRHRSTRVAGTGHQRRPRAAAGRRAAVESVRHLRLAT